MSTVIAKIDISGPTGKRILRDLQNHPKVAKIEIPLPKELEGKRLYTV
jgi:N-acetyl-gamma-glutamylphosphate reductase